MLNDYGTLYVVATPIGNLGDISFRAIEAIKSSETIYCEDTRVTLKLLNHFDIQKKLKPYHKYNEKESALAAKSELLEGKNIALLSDAGSPVISDPGFCLLDMAIEENINIEYIPGANAAISAFVYSGFHSDKFFFGGFLPKKTTALKKELNLRDSLDCPSIWFVSIHSLQETLKVIAEEYPDRIISLSREMTKIHEETIRGTAEEVLAKLSVLKGEVTIVLSQIKKESASLLDMEKLMEEYQELNSINSKDALKLLAKKYGVSKSSLYRIFKV